MARRRHPKPPTPAAVTLAYVHDADVSYSFHASVTNLLMFDVGHHGRLARGGYIAMRCARSSDLPEARNKVAATFLARDAEWLLVVDTDMGFTPDTLERLLDAADPTDRPVVGALCFSQRETAGDGMGGFVTSPRVTILDWVSTPDGQQQFAGRTTYPVNSLVRCAGTGSACILIHRTVLERIVEAHGQTWYTRLAGSDGAMLGEDVSFCVRAGALDIPIHVHTGVRTSHLKHQWLAEADFWRHSVAPPATEQTAVLVPVMQRPQNAAPFMASLRASTGMATVYAIADEDDQMTQYAWSMAGATVLYLPGDEPGTFAEKVNHGYAATDEPWAFICGDDVRFRPGWLDQAQAVADQGAYDVIGTNDLGNPKVMAGDHATHLLIRRTYIDAEGASWDGPKVLAHEGYRHWYVDDEIVTAAKQRGVWAMALGSVVEHLHPRWGKADHDPVYELGDSHADADRATFTRRAKDNAPSGF